MRLTQPSQDLISQYQNKRKSHSYYLSYCHMRAKNEKYVTKCNSNSLHSTL